MQPGERAWTSAAWIDTGGKPVAVVNHVTVVDPTHPSAWQGPLVELPTGERMRVMSIERLAESEADAKRMAADRLDELAKPILDRAAQLRQEAAAAVAAEQVVIV